MDMLSRCLRICAAALLVIVTVGSAGAAEKKADVYSAAALSQPPRDGWRTNGGSFFNQRYSQLPAIDRSNDAQLTINIAAAGSAQPGSGGARSCGRHEPRS
jgi:glucose dehydrogenase